MPTDWAVINCTTASGYPRILIGSEVVAHTARFRQTSCWKREAGGQLFAQISTDVWRITEATGPRRGDLRHRFAFRANRYAEQREIDQRFASDLHYVGDWHTHPQRLPVASETDLSSMRDMVDASGHELIGFLMMIVGTEPSPEGLWVSLHLTSGRWERLSVS